MQDGPDAKRLAVLIDGENMPAKFADTIFDVVAGYGDASVRRLYGDLEQSSMSPWKAKLAPLAIKPMVQPQNTVGKNASDIALVIDAMDLLATGRFDGFVLVSSDSDFTSLAIRLREQSAVWGIGEQKTPESFRMACKQFITIDNVAAPAQTQAKTEKPVVDLNQAFQRIANTAAQSNDADGWATVAWLGSQLRQRYPDWDTKTYGERSLSNLVKKIGRFEMEETENDLRIRVP